MTKDLASYLPLEHSLGIAGYHTGEDQYLVSTHIERDVVRYHEMVHGRIFDETSDGLLHRLLIRKQQGHAAVDDRTAAHLAADFLLNDTRVAHERAATYLGIKQLDSHSQRTFEQSVLPPEYAEYYRFFGSILDTPPAPSYIQYTIAWAVTAWAFSSSRLLAICSDRWRYVRNLIETEGPTERLNAFAESLITVNPRNWMEGIVDRAMTKLSARDLWENVWSEADWTKHTKTTTAEETERAIFAEVQQWLTTTLARPRLLAGDVVDDAFRQVLDEAHITLIGDIPPVSPADLVEASDEVAGARLKQITQEQDRVVIKSAASARTNIAHREYIGAIHRRLRFNKEFICILYQGTNVERPYVVYIDYADKDRVYSVNGSPFQMSYRDLRSLLNRLSTRDRTPPITVVYPSQHYHSPWSQPFERNRLRWSRARSLQLPMGSKRVHVVPFIYQTRHFSRVLENVPGSLMRLEVTLANATGDLTERYNAFWLFPHDQTWTPYVKFVPPSAISGWLMLIERLARRGRIKILPLGGVSYGIQQATIAVWDSFEEI